MSIVPTVRPPRGLAAFLLVWLLSIGLTGLGQQLGATRTDTLLSTGWKTQFSDSPSAYEGFQNSWFEDHTWQQVRVPHNWEEYAYDHQDVHGTRYGSAWYRTTFQVARRPGLDRTFLFFEGVSAYATVWVNGRLVGTHVGGLTTFTLDITDAVRAGEKNLLAVRADNPQKVRDLPWVAGDGSDVLGFAEGAQPLGIFRPVHLVQTASVRVEPFGVDIWNDADISAQKAKLLLTSEIHNYGSSPRRFVLRNELLDRSGHVVATIDGRQELAPHTTALVPQSLPQILNPHLWSIEDPYLYQVRTTIREAGAIVDTVETTYGIRWISWPASDGKGGVAADGRFLLNGKPVFLRGIAEYEHLLGGSHAFSDEQIAARVHEVEAAGFNAFRDAHYPHNLLYQHYWETDGVLWWPQFSAHIYFDNDAFRANFKRLLADWVKEHRDSPSLILWGLQNESVLPTDFAEECVRLIRQLDPTTSTQRKVVTCNFGTGTDWNVPQNWSGTYGGQLDRYAEELRQEVLVGEYGAWRSLGFHAEDSSASSKLLTEDRMTMVMETKLRLGEEASAKSAGHFAWLLATHENPGRLMRTDGTQIADGIRDLDHIGPANNKGLFTLWGEPLDVFYMYRSNYVSAEKQPTVYIAAHTWPDRWSHPGPKSGITVYSNCDEVELFNDIGVSLGVQKNPGIGHHFEWDNVTLRYNVLYAVGRVRGKVAATDTVLLNNLPPSPHLSQSIDRASDLTAPQPGQHYLYRIHTGGPAYRDRHQNLWAADQHFTPDRSWGFTSWADAYPNCDPELGSRRLTNDAIAGTSDPALFRSFRYGRDQLKYHFQLPNGEYRIELYMVEPWYGRAGINAKGWRLFDVAVNGKVVLHNLDIWSETGFNRALKKVVHGTVTDGRLEIGFPYVASGQAIISAIAISTAGPVNKTPEIAPQADLISDLHVADTPELRTVVALRYLDNGDAIYSDRSDTLAGLPASLLDADWIQFPDSAKTLRDTLLVTFTPASKVEGYILYDANASQLPGWLQQWRDTGLTCQSIGAAGDHAYRIYEKRLPAQIAVSLGPDGGSTNGAAMMYTVLVKRSLPSPLAPDSAPRTPVFYSADQATVENGELINASAAKTGKAEVRFHNQEGSIRWKFYVGVSGSYRLSIRYALPAGQDTFATAQLLDTQGNEVDSAPIHLMGAIGETPLKPVSLTVTLNAGNYDFVLKLPKPSGLTLETLEIQ